jgi:hypothetical protein
VPTTGLQCRREDFSANETTSVPTSNIFQDVNDDTYVYGAEKDDYDDYIRGAAGVRIRVDDVDDVCSLGAVERGDICSLERAFVLFKAYSPISSFARIDVPASREHSPV